MFRKTFLITVCFIIGLLLPFNVFASDTAKETTPSQQESIIEQEESEEETRHDDSVTNVRQHFLKVVYDGKVIFHEQVSEGKLIQVKNAEGEIIESEVLRREETLELQQPETSDGYMLSYWDIKDEGKHLVITPKLIEVKALNITFNALDGGNLIQNNALTKVITKSIDENTTLEEILPDTMPSKHHKLSGWFIESDDDEKFQIVENLDSETISNDSEYYAIFFPDMNNNDIDDRTEEITVTLVTNVDDKTEEIKIHVGESIELPKLERKDYIFMGWYADEDFKEKFNNQEHLIIDDVLLYAKWEKAEKVIEENQGKPITDEDISNQIENYLNERLRGIESQLSQQNQQQNASKASNNNNPNNKSNSNESLTFRESTSSSTPNSEANNNEVSAQTNGESEVLTFTESKYVFKNENIGKQFMVKFLDENSKFLFSITLPYGRAIHLLDENDNIVKEYAVRQDTTITLDVNDYINDDSMLIKFDSRTIQKNNSYITEIFPVVNHVQPPLESTVSSEVVENDDSSILPYIIGGNVVVSVIGLGIYFILTRWKNKSDVANMELN